MTIGAWLRGLVILGAFAAVAWAGLGTRATLGTTEGVATPAPRARFVNAVEALRPLARGEMQTFIPAAEPAAPSAAPFRDANGEDYSIGDFRGRILLVNFWATWCGPCRREMPALARLEAGMGGPEFAVLAISIDRRGMEVIEPFLAEIGVEKLAAYVDPSGRIARDYGAYGLPVSVLLDREGRELGRVTGPAEWDSADARALVTQAIASTRPGPETARAEEG